MTQENKVSFYPTNEIKQKLAQLAERERRSVSQMCAVLIERALTAKPKGKVKP